jgi:hypothetical protein
MMSRETRRMAFEEATPRTSTTDEVAKYWARRWSEPRATLVIEGSRPAWVERAARGTLPAKVFA